MVAALCSAGLENVNRHDQRDIGKVRPADEKDRSA